MKGLKMLVCFMGIAIFLGAQTALAGSATVSWNANTESDLAGYKVYYGTSQRTGTDPKSCGLCGYASSVNVGNVTSYTFNNLTDGLTYYFSVSAIDTSNNESVFSTQVSKVIPTGSTSFSVGQRVQTTSNLNVRSTPSTSGTLLGTQPLGSLGTIVSGGQSAGGYYWWNVNYDSGADGWSVENYLTSAPVGPATPLAGDLNLDHIVNSLDFSLLNSQWNQNYPTYDLNSDNIINSLDYAILSFNWLKTW